jgi:hypothetical protein
MMKNYSREDILRLDKIWGSLEYLPYGGQNDYFIEHAEVLGIYDVVWSDMIAGYAPSSCVSRVGGDASILPVSYRRRVTFFCLRRSRGQPIPRP